MHNSQILTGRKILIVEDDLSSRLYLNKVLERAGAVLLNAGDGASAVETLRNEPEIDLVLMDIQLPVLDGYEAAKCMREFRKEIPIIAQTAYGMHSDKERLMRSGFNGYVIKPIMPDMLLEEISSCLEIHPG